MTVRTLSLFDEASVRNLGVLTRRAMKLDHRAVVRFRNLDSGRTTDHPGDHSTDYTTEHTAEHPADLCQAWLTTPFGSLAGRTVRGRASVDGMVVYADALATGTADALAKLQGAEAPSPDNPIEVSAGVPADAAWSAGPMPPATGWTVVDEVPAQQLRQLERQGQQLTEKESGPMGPPQSLLESVVIEATADTDPEAETVRVTMRDVFALTAMGFVPEQPAAGELVRVSQKGRWHRLDGRFGAVAAASGNLGVLPL